MKNVQAPGASFRLALSILFLVTVAAAPCVALADGALTNGSNHSGTIEIGGLDTWTFQAAKNDSITISIGETTANAEDVDFYPWIRLKAPDGSDIDNGGATSGDWGTSSASIDVRAPLGGTYTLLVAHYPYDMQRASGTYTLTLARSPGPYTISAGDEGGPMANTVSHAGLIPQGDIDVWYFQALKNDSITVSIGEVMAGADPRFYPWIRLRTPDGSDRGSDGGTTGDWGTNAAQISLQAPMTGIYTVLVANYPYQRQEGPGTYTLTGSGLRPVSPSPTGILAVAGSLQGNGAFFRTRVQIHNPRTTPISGRFVFHRAGASGSASDPSLAYSLQGGQTIDYPDLLPAMGVAGGLGSIDIMTDGDPVPLMAARVFSDAGENGTAGFFLEPVSPEAALRSGESGVLIAPADPLKARLNLGVRTLDTGASFVVTVRDKNGALRSTITKTYAPNYFEQVSAVAYLGLSLNSSDILTFTMSSGRAIIYGGETDNKTQDPSAQYAKKTF